MRLLANVCMRDSPRNPERACHPCSRPLAAGSTTGCPCSCAGRALRGGSWRTRRGCACSRHLDSRQTGECLPTSPRWTGSRSSRRKLRPACYHTNKIHSEKGYSSIKGEVELYLILISHNDFVETAEGTYDSPICLIRLTSLYLAREPYDAKVSAANITPPWYLRPITVVPTDLDLTYKNFNSLYAQAQNETINLIEIPNTYILIFKAELFIEKNILSACYRWLSAEWFEW